ncbi:histidine kinase [Actinoplanes oblitus]|uniref:histidine kinase n=1 Tax=Actinoplanes oblitus TaxID=3040509 RepID=A0ABY8WMC0_9ACTN|nr:histidine kinase [Actinoplanes oblitus]WIM97484.1 histidine kinase [Actinoplanes oblitus]
MLTLDRQRLLPLWRRVRNLILLVFVTVGILQDNRPGVRLLTGVALAGLGGTLLALRILPPRRHLMAACVTMAAGLWLIAVAGPGIAPIYLILALASCAAVLDLVTTGVLAGIGLLALTVALAARDVPVATIAIWCGITGVVTLLVVLRRQRTAAAEQERLLADEQALAAMLAERARLAREIHDVLAHSLSALSVQLETAAALLERDRTAEAAVLVDRAGTLARDGLTETRRAVSALRGDPLPVPELVGELTRGYGRDLDAPATFTVDGEPRELDAETGLALFRAAQEALSNVRKHAPGSAVETRLAFEPDAVVLRVRNHGPAGPPVTGLSSGYGLIGLRERAELAGGTAQAGPDRDGWLVDVRMPG